jgi:hypothetical protein
MKKLSLSALLFLLSFFIIGQNNPISIQSHSTKQRNPDAISLPFFEDWSSASLETNNWTTECENWAINFQEGNENPSVEFSWDPWFQSEYSCSLVSGVFNGDILEVGQIILDFDIRLDNRQATSDEKLLIEVFDGTDWNTVIEFTNDGNMDWQPHSIDITDYTLGHTFQIRFNATGQNSFHILSWFVDNISIYRECEAPENLAANFIWLPPLDSIIIAAEVRWTPPESTIVDKFKWIHWDDGENTGGVGLTDGGFFSVASKWDSLHLVDFFGDTIQSIRFILNDSGFSEIIVKIWTGQDGDNLIYQDTVDNPIIGNWNEQILDSAILISSDIIYWIGYTITGQPLQTFPASYDEGPAVQGYGDLINTGENGWEKISDFGMDYNFNIQMKLLNNDVSDSTNCAGFNIYRQWIGYDEDYVFYHFTPFDNDIDWYVYNDEDIGDPWQDCYCYKVEAVWANNGDTCISDFAKTIPQTEDYVCVLASDISIFNENKQANIYPNPATNQLNITTRDGQAIEEVSIYNLTGQKVFQGKPQNNVLDISKLQAGMYIIEVVIGRQKIRQKIVVR